MEATIRRAESEDVPEILRMMEEFSDLVGMRQYLTVRVEGIVEAAFGPAAFVRLLIASTEDGVVGYAIYYPHFSSFRGERGFFLEDIFVDEACRSRGLGLRMLREIAREASDLGFQRIDFHVQADNSPAIAFYRKHGAGSNDDEIHFKFAGDAFAALARGGADLS